MANPGDANLLDALPLPDQRADGALVLPWPSASGPATLHSFSTLAEWRRFIDGLSLRSGLPQTVSMKFRRAQKLYFLGWLDLDLIKAGELIALTALELALVDRYGKKPLAHLLKRLVEDGLTDELVPLARRTGVTVVGQPTGQTHISLSEIRNFAAHGDPFDGLPWAGLLELVRDLIEYAYRNFPTEPQRPASN